MQRTLRRIWRQFVNFQKTHSHAKLFSRHNTQSVTYFLSLSSVTAAVSKVCHQTNAHDAAPHSLWVRLQPASLSWSCTYVATHETWKFRSIHWGRVTGIVYSSVPPTNCVTASITYKRFTSYIRVCVCTCTCRYAPLPGNSTPAICTGQCWIKPMRAGGGGVLAYIRHPAPFSAIHHRMTSTCTASHHCDGYTFIS